MAEKGFDYFDVIADGEIHRFNIEKSGDKAGWYILFIDDKCPAGVFGSWKTSEKYTWSAKSQSEMTEAERKEFNRQMDETKKKRAQKKVRLQEEARQRVAEELDAARPAGNDHPYLQTKKVPSYGLKKNTKDQLMIPARDNDDVIWSVQYISPDGDKKFEKDGAIKGKYFTISGDDKIYICEGYATGASIHEATDGTVIVAFFTGNLKQVAQNIKTKYPNREIIVCADNDQFTEGNPGVTKAKEAVAAICARYVVPEFENQSIKSTDFNDLAHLVGIQAVKSQIFEQLEKQPVRNDSTFKLIHNSDVQLKCPEWLIHGAIEKDALALVFGDPESAKSFLAMDIACSVATGKDFHGRKVKQGPCHYIAGEGFNGLKRRLTAWQIYHGINVEEAPLFMSPTAASLCDEEQSEIVISAINETAVKYGPPALIIIDTVARNFGTGDENSTKDMTAFISAVDNIRYATGNPTVLLIHHTGHAEKGRARG
jgi:phage/plasmid primase-like uncharacterized protein